MIRASLLVTGIGELATLAVGSVPRIGPAMRELGLLHHAAVAVDRGKFVFVGTERQARHEVRLRSGGSRWNAGGAAITPGFVDAHTHLLFAGDRSAEIEDKLEGRGYTEIARRGGGMFSTVRATRHASSELLLRQSAARVRRMLRSGSTTIEVKSGYALDHLGELRLLSLIPSLARRTRARLIPTYLGAHAIPPEFAGRSDAYVEQMIRETLPVIAHRRLANFCDVFCEPGFFSLRQSERLLRAAAGLGFGTKIHADEFVASGGAALAARLPTRSAEHLLVTPSKDRDALARARVTAVLLPVTPFASFTGTRSDGRAFVDAGVPVALGSDLSPNSWIESMSAVLSHAVYAARLSPAEALTAATVNAAHAIGVDGLAGRIAPGYSADLCVFDVPSVEAVPYRIGVDPVHVLRQGIWISSR